MTRDAQHDGSLAPQRWGLALAGAFRSLARWPGGRALRAGVAALRWPGLAGLGLLVAAGCVGLGWLPVLSRQAEADVHAARQARQAVWRAAQGRRSGPAAVPVPAQGDGRSAFLAAFAAPEALHGRVAHLWALAQGQGLEVARTEFSRTADPDLGLTRERVLLPVEGTYATLHAFVMAALHDDPALSLDVLRIERPDSDDQRVRARIELSLWSRLP